MQPNSNVALAVRRALILGLVPASMTPALAQEAATAESLETVVVTGSRLKQANLESSSPITQVTAADITTQGVTRIEDLINQLPQAFAAQNATVANGASGTATVNLRGLGSSRTLVLVDGRRMPYGGVSNSAADLNQIPTQLVERVEVLTGGASAVYGSDAIAGVVNFITKKEFEGVEISGQYSFYQHNNGFGGPGATGLRQVIAGRAATNPAQFKLPPGNVTDGFGREGGIIVGVNSGDGRGNFVAYFNAQTNDEILQRDRDFSACSLGGQAGTPPSFTCGGSSTASPGRFTDFATYNFTVGSDGSTWRGFSGATDQYNFGPTNHFLRPADRYTMGASGHYELNDKADVYTQLMFTDYRSIAQIAPGGIFLDTSTINCDNPFIPTANLAAIGCTPAKIAAKESTTMYIGRRNTEGGGRQQSFTNQSYRAVVGVRGDINDAWGYDFAAQRSTLKADQQTLNYFVIDRIKKALDVVLFNGVPTCRSALPGGSDSDCKPYNAFKTGAVTQAALDYLQAPGLQTGTVDQEVYTLTFTGDLNGYGVKLPAAEEGAQVAFGAEYRRDSLENTTDALLASAGLSGTGGPTNGLKGATQVKDLFFEGRLPLVQGKTFAESLSLDAAYRYSDYGKINTDTYKLGLEWSPVSDFRVRGSFQRAVRAANIIELFTAQGFGLFDIDGDPCGAAIGTTVSGAKATAAQCLATGVPAAQIGKDAIDSPAGQYQLLGGGNPNLQPEKSDTFTAGIIITPSALPGFVASVDYFDIKVDETVSSFGPNNTIKACYNNNDASACSRIKRNALGQLWLGSGYVEDLSINIGSIGTKGWDLNLSYSGLDIGAGSLNFNLTGTLLDELSTEPGPGLAKYDCVGFFAGACGTPNPEWRHQFRVGYETPWNLDLALTWRYYGSVEGYQQAATRIDRSFAAESYFDLAGTYVFNEKIAATIGVNNVLDNDPSINASVGTTGNGNTYPQTYDALGRYLFARVKVAF